MGAIIPDVDYDYMFTTLDEPQRYTIANGQLVEMTRPIDYLRDIAKEAGGAAGLVGEPFILGIPASRVPAIGLWNRPVENRAMRRSRCR